MMKDYSHVKKILRKPGKLGSVSPPSNDNALVTASLPTSAMIYNPNLYKIIFTKELSGIMKK